MKPIITHTPLDQMLQNDSKPSDLLGPDDLLAELKNRIINSLHREFRNTVVP